MTRHWHFLSRSQITKSFLGKGLMTQGTHGRARSHESVHSPGMQELEPSDGGAHKDEENL